MVIRERRAYPRKRVSLTLEGRTNNGTTDPASRGRLRLQIDDLSLGGLSAATEQPIVRGSRIAVFFPPQHPCIGALASGNVVRCERSMTGYHIGIEFDRFPSPRGRMPYSAQALSEVGED